MPAQLTTCRTNYYCTRHLLGKHGLTPRVQCPAIEGVGQRLVEKKSGHRERLTLTATHRRPDACSGVLLIGLNRSSGCPVSTGSKMYRTKSQPGSLAYPPR